MYTKLRRERMFFTYGFDLLYRLSITLPGTIVFPYLMLFPALVSMLGRGYFFASLFRPIFEGRNHLWSYQPHVEIDMFTIQKERLFKGEDHLFQGATGVSIFFFSLHAMFSDSVAKQILKNSDY